MQIVLATTNPHKLQEMQSVFDAETGAVDLQLLDWLKREMYDGLTEPVEDQPTFEGNAVIKARHYALQPGYTCLADDSGIEVDALDGAPGVLSARYSGQRGPRSEVDPANNVKLLEALADVPIEKRTARFVCAMCLVVPANRLAESPGAEQHIAPGNDFAQLVVRGTVEGRILLPEEAADPAKPEAGRGANGFGYDPLFVLGDDHELAGKTTAELAPQQKNAISHRGNAARKLLAEMQTAGML